MFNIFNWFKKKEPKSETRILIGNERTSRRHTSDTSCVAWDDIESIDISESKLHKYNILLSEDEYGLSVMTLSDIEILYSIGRKMNEIDPTYTSVEMELFVILSKDERRYLKELDSEDYNFIDITGDMCGFESIKAIEYDEIKIDGAMLDIVYGGSYTIDGHNVRLDGLDVLEALVKRDKEIPYVILSGCSIGVHSDESIKFNNVINNTVSLSSVLVFKDNNIVSKQHNLLKLMKSIHERK